MSFGRATVGGVEALQHPLPSVTRSHPAPLPAGATAALLKNEQQCVMVRVQFDVTAQQKLRRIRKSWSKRLLSELTKAVVAVEDGHTIATPAPRVRPVDRALALHAAMGVKGTIHARRTEKPQIDFFW